MIVNANENASNNLNEKKFIQHFHRNGRQYDRCEPCFQKRNVVKMFKRKAKLPSIAQEAGNILRSLLLQAIAVLTYM